jgi:hypothetical protein
MTVHAPDNGPERLRLKGLYPVEGKPNNIRAQWTGAKRCPKKGEFYLSGSPISAYRAFEDLTSEYHIARLVEVREVKSLEIVRFL